MSVAPLEHAGPFTEEDLFALPDDGQRHELVDGSFVVSPAPGNPHQRVSSRLWKALDAVVPDGLEVLEAINLRLRSDRLLIPDLAVLTTAGASAAVATAADVVLVVEIVSPSSAVMDRLLKPALYAEAGIPWFVRVDPDGPRVVVHRLENGVYRVDREVGAGTVLKLDEPFPVAFDPAVLLATRAADAGR